MLLKTSSEKISYRLFLNELNDLLKESGIVPSRLPVMALAGRKKNRADTTSLKADQQVGSVIIYIEEHLTEELSLERLADEVKLSRFQLIRRFHDEQGTTPWKFLIRKRIDKAKELLEDGMSPGQTAVETGFYDQSHMNKAFREETGLTPKEYQEKFFSNKN